jgi:hypothetical protein
MRDDMCEYVSRGRTILVICGAVHAKKVNPHEYERH